MTKSTLSGGRVPSGRVNSTSVPDVRAGHPGRGCSSLAIKLHILPGRRILQRLEVGKDADAAECLPNIRLDLLEQMVAALNRPVPRDENMHRHEATGAALPRAQCMEFDPLPLILFKNLRDLRAIVWWKCGIKQ